MKSHLVSTRFCCYLFWRRSISSHNAELIVLSSCWCTFLPYFKLNFRSHTQHNATDCHLLFQIDEETLLVRTSFCSSYSKIVGILTPTAGATVAAAVFFNFFQSTDKDVGRLSFETNKRNINTEIFVHFLSFFSSVCSFSASLFCFVAYKLSLTTLWKMPSFQTLASLKAMFILTCEIDAFIVRATGNN